MISFLVRLWGLAAAYRFRLIMGIMLGIITGLRDPALVFSVYLVFALIFPQAGGDEIARTVERIRDWSPGAADWLQRTAEQMALDPSLSVVIPVVSLLPLVMLIGGAANYGNQYLINWVAVRSLGDLRSRLFRHFLDMPLRFYQRHATGELLARITSDISALNSVLSKSFVSLVRDPVALLVFATMLVVSQPKLTFMALVLLPLCIGPVIFFAEKLRKSAKATQTNFAAVSQTLHEGLGSVRVVKAYNLEPVVVEEHDRRTRNYISQFMRVIRASEIPGPLIEFVGSVGVAGLLGYIALRQGQVTFAGFLQFVISLFLMYDHIKRVVKLGNEYVRARGSSERVFGMLDQEPELREPEQPKELKAAGADVEFRNVTFAYESQPVLQDFSLTVKAGQLVALVGQSGSGKTTVTNLLLRFYDADAGSVQIGGVDVREVRGRDLREQVALVTQETILFNDTIRRNIGYGRPGAGDDDIEQAAKHAYAHDFITKAEEGYDTVIGERGGNLSGGQRQRLAIARAILRDAPILVLDEATSALDTESERAVQAALSELMKGRTTLCIAHRLSTIRHADVIVVMDQGRIVEQGRHEELLAKDGHYRRLYELQFKSGKDEVE
ncbi:MAG: lipid export permease/ATP-binding protein MsbA [Verrucomicrobiota bacterium]